MAVTTATALLISAVASVASAVGTSYVTSSTAKKTEKAADQRNREAMALQESLASQVTAGSTKQEGNVDLQSVEAKEDEAIRSRSSRSRLRVDKKQSGSTSVGTGLSVG